MTAFEDGLWERLVEEHDADLVSLSAPRERTNRRPLVIGGGLTGLAAATAAVIVGISAATTAAPAYAMTQNADGSYTVTINDIATAIPALNAKFAQLGIEETVLPVTANCTSTLALDVDPTATMSETVTLTPGGTGLAPGYTGFLAAEQLSDGQVAMAMGAMKPPLPSCISSTTAMGLEPGTGGANGVPTITTETVTPAS